MKDPDLESFAEAGLRYPLIPEHEGYVTSDDCRIYYSTFGKGQPVLLLHGGMGNGTNWANQIVSLVESGHQTIVMDTRGHGRSSNGIKAFSYSLFAQDVRALVEHLRLSKFMVVGWSDGACTALELVRAMENFVTGIVFFACNVDPTGTLEFKMTQTIQNCLTRHRIDFETMTPTFEVFENLSLKLQPMQKNEPNYSLEQLHQISVPVTVLHAEHDEFIKFEHSRYIANSLGNANWEVLNGLSHFAPLQDPETFNKVILQCIERFEKQRSDFSSRS